MKDLIFPPEAGLTIERITKVEQQIDIYARSQRNEAACPDCQTVSIAVHGRYWRHPQGVSCLGFKVRLHLEVRRFACRGKGCSRKTIAEQLRAFLPVRARRTTRLRAQHLAVAYALGGEAGSRLARQLGMPISGDTLIWDIRQAPEGAETTVRVVGVDDWAMRKGCNYGTIVVDLEKRRPIELLGSRQSDRVAAWLQAHPEIEIVSRDRGKDYIKAATLGAPQAKQVADRWHLLANLRQAVTSFLQEKPACLQAAAQGADVDLKKEVPKILIQEEDSSTGPATRPSSALRNKRFLTKVEQDKLAGHARRQARYEQVRERNRAGYSNRAIARQMKMAPRTVRKYIEADMCPQYPAGRVRQSKLRPWLPYLERRWQDGCTNASQLWREIDEKGFPGSLGLGIQPKEIVAARKSLQPSAS